MRLPTAKELINADDFYEDLADAEELVREPDTPRRRRPAPGPRPPRRPVPRA